LDVLVLRSIALFVLAALFEIAVRGWSGRESANTAVGSSSVRE